MEIHKGDVYRMKTGEGIRIESIDPASGVFTALVRGLDGKWTNMLMKGEASKLPEFLHLNEAVLEQ